jgi:methionyl-tRNA formyltransferase
VACSAALVINDVTVDAIVVGPNVPSQAAETIAGQFPEKPPIVVTSRPDKDSTILDLVGESGIDYLFSCLYEYRIRPGLLNAVKKGGVNIHTSVLPNNGGFHTSYWGIINSTPLGATIHWMDETLDTGDIIGQERFEDDGLMTSMEVKKRQLDLCVELFHSYLPLILQDKAPRIPQLAGGSFHLKNEIGPATTFDGSDTITLGEMLRLARATSYESHGFHVRIGDRVFKVQAAISELPS